MQTLKSDEKRARGRARPARSRLRHVFWLVTGFWRSRASYSSWLLLVALFTMQFTTVYISVWRNSWERRLGDALQLKNGAAITSLIASFFLILSVAAGASVLQIFLYGYTELRWRTWLTENYMTRWLENSRFLRIERSALIDNPDQRISEDVRDFTLMTLTTVIGFTLAVTSVSAFVAILWGFSSNLGFRIGPLHVVVPGDLVWAAVLYMFLGSWAIVLLGRPLIGKTMQQQHYEADFRYLLINVRRNAEQIAFARAGASERRKLISSFASIYDNTIGLIWARVMVTSGQSVYSSVDSILPLLFILPRFFAGAVTLGVLLQVRSAFGQLTSSLSWFVQVYPALAQLAAVINRLKALDDAIEKPMPIGIDFETRGSEMKITNLALSTPSDEKLLHIDSWTICAGERWAIRGTSGVGKSTLLRALAGLWPHGSGSVQLPAGADIMFLPQKPYIPIGSLHEALAFPDPAESFDLDDCRRALIAANLARLTEDLANVRPWNDELSPGEQQRLGFARILIHRPDVLFLDEATSALDAANAGAMYDLLFERLPNLTLISIVHADFLSSLHNRVLSVESGVARPLSTASLDV